jgi:hypothetical protein
MKQQEEKLKSKQKIKRDNFNDFFRKEDEKQERKEKQEREERSKERAKKEKEENKKKWHEDIYRQYRNKYKKNIHIFIPNNETHYDILDVNSNNTLKDIKKCYIKLALINHPDKGGDKAIFQKIANAWQAIQEYHSI